MCACVYTTLCVHVRTSMCVCLCVRVFVYRHVCRVHKDGTSVLPIYELRAEIFCSFFFNSLFSAFKREISYKNRCQVGNRSYKSHLPRVTFAPVGMTCFCRASHDHLGCQLRSQSNCVPRRSAHVPTQVLNAVRTQTRSMQRMISLSFTCEKAASCKASR